MVRRFVAALLLCCFLAGRPAAGESQLGERARMLLEYQSFSRGDRDGGVRFTVSASKDLQNTPLAELAVRIALAYDPATNSAVTVGEAEARRILATESELSSEYRDILRRFVARSLASSGKREEALEMHQRRGLAMDWFVAGPFFNRGAANFHTRALPEAGAVYEADAVAAPPTASQFRDWIKNPPWRPVAKNRAFPYVRPWRWAGRAVDGSMLMSTGLVMEEADNKSGFHIFSETSWRLFVDGALVAEVNKNESEEPIEHMVLYPLSPGAHTVALHLFPPRAGLAPREVRVALRLESGARFSWKREAVSFGKMVDASARREARPLRYLVDLRDSMNESPIVMATYAVACAEQGMYDQAAWWAETAAKNAPDDVNIQLLAGIHTYMNTLLPPERRRDLAVDWYMKTLRMRPDLVPSLLFMARVTGETGHPREAAEYLRRAYAVNPTSLDVLMAKGEWASAFASGATARVAWDECGKAFPNSLAVQMAIASMPQEEFTDMERRLAACQAAVEAGPYNQDATLRLAETLAASGNNQQAEYVLRNALELFDGEVAMLTRIAAVYSRLSLYTESIRILSRAVALTPDNPELWRLLGDTHMEAGDTEKAMQFWKVSLDANPGQFELAEMLAFLSGHPDRLYTEGDYDAIVVTAGTDPNRYPGDVVRLLDRSVITFARDGSYRRLTHEVDMAKNRRGGEVLAGIDTRGELLTARIVFPNGNTLEPEPFPGQGGLRLPVIMPGAAREVRSVESVSVEGEVPTVPPWFFQDPSGRMPLLISEYVVRAPEDFPLTHVVRNLGNDVEFDIAEQGDFLERRWTANLSIPSHEPDAVHISERVPSVEIGVKTTWDDVVNRELRRFEGRLTPSMRMRALVQSLYRPLDGRPDAEQAARAIYRYVCDNIDPAPGGDMAAHVQMNRMGDRSLLLLALLRTAGLDAHPAAARPSTRFMHPPTWELPSSDIFTVPMVRLTVLGGRTYWLDTRFDSLPFGKIADDLSGASVLAYLPSGPLFETLPNLPAEESIALKERLLRLPGPGGVLEVTGRSLRRGVAGLRRGLALANADTDTRRRMLLASLFPVFPDAVLTRFDLVRQEEADASSHERYEITSRLKVADNAAGVKSVGLCMLPVAVISEEARTMTNRQSACHIRTEHIAEDRNIFILPDGAAFTSLPRPVHIPSKYGIYQLRVLTQGADRVEIVRNYHIPAQRVQPWEWADFLEFLRQVDLAEKQWVEYAVPVP